MSEAEVTSHGDTSQGNELRTSFVTKIDVTAEGAANGHISTQFNGGVVNGDISAEGDLPNGNTEQIATEELDVNKISEIQNAEESMDKVIEDVTNNVTETTSEVKVQETISSVETTVNEVKGQETVSEVKVQETITSVKTTVSEVKVQESVTSGETTIREAKEQETVSPDDIVPVIQEIKPPQITEKELQQTDISIEGIDELASATELTTITRDGPVKIRLGDKPNQSEKPVTLITVFKKTAERAPNHLALAVKRGGVWVKWTYKQYYTDVIAAAKSFIKLGVEPYHGVGILGFNSPEWLISDIGAIFAGGLATGIYATNTPEAVAFVAKHSEANVLVVENNQQLQKVLQVWDSLPHLKAVVQYTGEVAERRDNVYSWQEFMKLGTDVPMDILQQRINMQSPNKCCTLIYTSGTTGDPKGVMLSHDNMVWTAKCFARSVKLQYEQEIVVSYLPLSHVAAQMIDINFPVTYGASVYFAKPDALKLTWTSDRMIKLFKFNFGSEIIISYLPLSHIAAQLMDIYMPVAVASAVYFAEPDALKGSLLGTLKEVRPTGFFGVPRVWEKFYEGIKAQARHNGAIKKKIGAWARGVGLKGAYAQMNKQSMPFGWGLANSLVFKKARIALGLDRCRFFMSGAAPIMKETLEFFYSLNMILHEVYGMSESSGPHTVGTNDEFKISTVGQCFPGAETKLANPEEDGTGEVCMGGRHVFMGYLNAPDKTEDTFDKDGWLHSGDLGKHDQKGFLSITGRIKELIITAGGENIAPVPVEDAVKEALPCISNCMLIGDKRKFLSMILCLKVDVNLDTGEPTDKLTQAAKDWCTSLGSNATTVADIIDKKDAVVLKAIQDGIDKANTKSVSRASKVQKWSIIPQDFSIPGGELGPTLKLRRPVVTKMYKKTIDAFYDDGEAKK